MPGKNRKGACGLGANTGLGGGKCRQSGDVTAKGQGTGQGGRGQGGCRKPQDGSRGPGQGRGDWRIVPSAGAKGLMQDFPDQGASAERERIERKNDPNQQALDEIMEAVRQMEVQVKG